MRVTSQEEGKLQLRWEGLTWLWPAIDPEHTDLRTPKERGCHANETLSTSGSILFKNYTKEGVYPLDHENQVFQYECSIIPTLLTCHRNYLSRCSTLAPRRSKEGTLLQVSQSLLTNQCSRVKLPPGSLGRCSTQAPQPSKEGRFPPSV